MSQKCQDGVLEMDKKDELLKEYLARGFSILPIRNDKRPYLTHWKQYQHRRPTSDEVKSWSVNYPDFNIGIINGKISGLVSLDFDTPESFKHFPDELKNTVQTQTARGYHLIYLNDQAIKSKVLNINKYTVELKGEGAYTIEPYSIINGFEYKFINPLTDLKSLPTYIEDLLHREREFNDFKGWKYQGKQSCIGQILKRELIPGERENGFFILYNLLLKNNNEQYSKQIIRKKNKMLTDPLPESELIAIFKQPYNKLGCNAVKGFLPYIDCTGCIYYKKGVTMKIPDIWDINRGNYTHTERRIMLEILTKQLLDEENNRPTIQTINQVNKTELSKTLKVSRQAIYDAINSLKKKGIFQ